MFSPVNLNHVAVYKNLKNHDRISWKCFSCNFIWEKTVVSRIYYNTGCPSCSSLANPKGEKTISKFLEKNNIKFFRQKTFEKCFDKRLLRFDFYIPLANICIEYNGRQHYEPIEYFGGDDAFEDRKNKDKIKSGFCKKNKIRLLEISYLDFKNIEKILKGIIL